MKDEILAGIQQNMRIESVRGEAQPDAPYGPGPKAALEDALELGRKLGFKVGQADNRIGWVEYGEGKEMVGVLGHVDVVPAGDTGWTYPAYGAEIHDGILWGRGCLDDKGPIIGSIYALKAIRDLNLPIDHNEQLYGDTINLKKVLCDILDYSLNKTSKGYIELNINSIIRKNVCRLIISIEDSSSFNNLDINDIKTNPKNELYDVYRLVVLLDGTMSVLSNLNGNVIKVILDQRMEEHEEVIDKYSNIFNNKKVLVVDDILATYKIIEKLLKDSDIELFGVLSGRECLDKIRNKEKFDLILLDEDLHYMSGDEVVKKLHSIRNFDIPVVLLTKDSNVEYDNSYKENGFDDYLLKPINKNKLNEVLNKYL